MAHAPASAPPRDGTSQTDRVRADLAPERVQLDDRGPADDLRAAMALAARLPYYDAKAVTAHASDGTLPTADWTGFFRAVAAQKGTDAPTSPERIAELLAADPARLDPSLRSPHMMLFLAFLGLLAEARGALNGLVARHLRYFYETKLGLTRRGATPDRVYALFTPAAGVAAAEVPDGTALSAGRDGLGRDLRYRVATRPGHPAPPPMVATHARLGRIAALRAEIRREGLAEARAAVTGTVAEAVFAMLRLALGHPSPGDALPDDRGAPVNVAHLRLVVRRLRFSQARLHLALFEFRRLMDTLARREGADAEWEEINRLFTVAGRAISNDPGFTLTPADPRDFDANLTAATGLTQAVFNDPLWFGGLTEVDRLEDLARESGRAEVAAAIETRLGLSVTQLQRLVELKAATDRDWALINFLLEKAGRAHRGEDFTLTPADPTDFDANFAAALGPVDFAGLGLADARALRQDITGSETYFHLPAEDILALLGPPLAATDPAPEDWERIETLLTRAHLEKHRATRRTRLLAVGAAARAEADPPRDAAGLAAMIADVTGDGGEMSDLAPLLSPSEEANLAALTADLDSGGDGGEDVDWPAVAALLERAERQREDYAAPLPQRTTWRGLHRIDDAPGPAAAAGARWPLFGAVDPTATKAPPEVLGLALASPALRLSGGSRDIRLTLGLAGDGDLDAVVASAPFRVLLSTAEGWVEAPAAPALTAQAEYRPDEAPADATGLRGLHLRLSLPVDFPALAPTPEDPLPGSPWPGMKLLLRQIAPQDPGPAPYAMLRNLRLARCHIAVSVGAVGPAGLSGGLTPVEVETDAGRLNGVKPFHPFGRTPVVGSGLLVFHPDLVGKRLRRVALELGWMGGPEDLDAWYGAYALGGARFTAEVQLLQRGHPAGAPAQRPLFTRQGGAQSGTAAQVVTLDADGAAPPYRPETAAPARLELQDQCLRLRLLAPDFQHMVYGPLAAQRAQALALAVADGSADAGGDGRDPARSFTVNPPYTPQLAPPSLHFEAAHEIDLADLQQGPQSDQVYHLHPFGATELTDAGAPPPLVPAYDDEGHLLIGVAGAQPPQSLAILFQLADGSADPDLPRADIRWSYLDGNTWRPFAPGALIQDTTRGLIGTGIVELAIPQVAPSTLMPAGFVWLRAAIARDTRAVCEAQALHPHAALAVFDDDGNDPAHYDRPLPPGSLRGPVQPMRRVGSVAQPYTSFGGAPAESDAAFFVRAGERLRHRERALSQWDYERLVLDRFPQIYKAKCLPSGSSPEVTEPGDVGLVVIPDIRNQLPSDPFQPKPPTELIAAIEADLAHRLPPNARLRVLKPDYLAVQIRVAVRFRHSADLALHRAQLIDELNRFLAPWAYDDGEDIVIGRRIYAGSVIAFLDARPTVAFVGGLKFFTVEDGEARLVQGGPDAAEGYHVQSRAPSTILVPAREHIIDIIQDDVFEEESFTGIGYMRVELDFFVG